MLAGAGLPQDKLLLPIEKSSAPIPPVNPAPLVDDGLTVSAFTAAPSVVTAPPAAAIATKPTDPFSSLYAARQASAAKASGLLILDTFLQQNGVVPSISIKNAFSEISSCRGSVTVAADSKVPFFGSGPVANPALEIMRTIIQDKMQPIPSLKLGNAALGKNLPVPAMRMLKEAFQTMKKNLPVEYAYDIATENGMTYLYMCKK